MNIRTIIIFTVVLSAVVLPAMGGLLAVPENVSCVKMDVNVCGEGYNPLVADAVMPNFPVDTVSEIKTVTSVDAGVKSDEGEQTADTTTKTRLNKAKGFNALDYIMERRYLNRGDEFSGPWYSHLFLEAGMGAEQLSAPTDDYKFNTLTSVRFGVGKRFNRLHSLRLSVHGGFGFQEGTNLLLGKAGGRIDHIFNLSSYFDGYNPTRPVELSSVIGIGGQMSTLRRNSGWKSSYEGHVGLQLKFYAGLQGAITIEPYIGISTDQSDVSSDKNWRKYDFFYGAGLNYIYYLGNSLSQQRRRKIIEERADGDRLLGDSVLQSWQQPWFVELAAGPHFMDSPELGPMSSLGHETALSVGKWLSPAIGIRFTASIRSATFAKDKYSSPAPSYDTHYERSYQKAYAGGRVDALINPLGFFKRFSWNRLFGGYLLFGGEIGRMVRYDRSELLNCYSMAYSLGAHFWTRIADGVQLFVEPRGSWYVYNIPYSDIDTRSVRCTDGGMSVNIGLTVSTYDRKYRHAEFDRFQNSRIKVGIGGGTNLIYKRSSVDGGGMDYNAQVWGEYDFSSLSSLRAAFEYISVGTEHITQFYDYNMAYPAENYLRSTRTGVWTRRYSLGVVSLCYSLDVTEALCAPRNRRLFGVTAYAGPALMMLWGEKSSLHPSERVQKGHECRLVEPVGHEVAFGYNAGVRLTASITRGLGVYLSPSVYVWHKSDLPGVAFMGTKHIETLNLGVEYRF